MTGSGGFTAGVGQESSRPNLIRQTFTLQGLTAVQAYDGSTGWQIQPFGGHKDPQLMGEDDLRDLQIASDFDGPLVDYKEKGNTVEYLNHDIVDGDDALRLKVTLKNGDIIYYYLDPDTYIEIARRSGRPFAARCGSLVDLGSHKPVNGGCIPFRSLRARRAIRSQTFTVGKMEVNVAADPADFAVPASLKQAPKPVADEVDRPEIAINKISSLNLKEDF